MIYRGTQYSQSYSLYIYILLVYMPCSANPHSTKSHPARGWPITLLYQGYFSAKSHSKRVTWDLAKPLIHLSSLYQITIIQFTHPQTGNNHTPITNITPRFPMKGREEEKTLSLTEGGAHIWVCLCMWVCVWWCHCDICIINGGICCGWCYLTAG